MNSALAETAARPRRDVAVIGTSLGGVHALQELVAGLPADHAGTVLVAMHMHKDERGLLAGILSRAGPLKAELAIDGMAAEPGRVLIAPADHHLLLEGGMVAVTRGPRENRHRPAIDPLFRSAAWSRGPRVVGVVLTGALDDGVAGLWAIKSCGGLTVVQEPGEAQEPSMPTQALLHNRIDHRLPLAEIGPLLTRLAREPLSPPPAAVEPPATLNQEMEYALMERGRTPPNPLGRLTPFTCPSCGGALWELDEGGNLRYRCHTGHAYSHESLLHDQDDAMEDSLYAALRVVREKAATLRRMAEKAQGPAQLGKDYERRARELDGTAEKLRSMLSRRPS